MVPSVSTLRSKLALLSSIAFVLGVTSLVVGPPTAGAAGGAPAIKHVFVVNLENKGYTSTFADNSPAQYLAKTLPPQGALLRQYYGTAHASLGNYTAQVSGQAPTPDIQADCGNFKEMTPATP